MLGFYRYKISFSGRKRSKHGIVFAVDTIGAWSKAQCRYSGKLLRKYDRRTYTISPLLVIGSMS